MVSPNTLRELYTDMVTARYYEERLQEEYLEGKQPAFDISAGPIPGELHLAAGQEAAAAGVCQHLRDDDTVTAPHRPHHVAIAKGVDLDAMTAEIFGYSNPQAINHAVELGIAMQLTNILRDLGEDLVRNRIYIPGEDLERFGVTEEELFRNEISDRFIELMKFQIQRSRYYYEEADKGIPMLNRGRRLPVLLARENYRRILHKIEENRYQVFSQRAYLNATEKFSILPKILYQLNTDP
jgi:hypothetical protein